MSVLTEVLKLFKYDPATDGDMTFNLRQALNDNWDKLDAAILLAIAAAGAYNPEESYAVGDYCTYKGKLRKCSTAIPTGEAWTEAHWTTTTVAAELAELSSQLSNAVSRIAYQPQTRVDFNTLALGSIRDIEFGATVDQSPYHTPLGELGKQENTWYIVETLSYAPNRVIQLAHLPYSHQQGSYMRYKHDQVWSPWVKIATATPPQEFNLPLADGFVHYVPGTKSTYSKSQDGLVVVHFYCKTSDGADILQNTTIATLPEGFRPSANVHIPANVSFDGSSVYSQDVATVVVGGNGRVWIAYPPAGCKAVTSTLVFYAAG